MKTRFVHWSLKGMMFVLLQVLICMGLQVWPEKASGSDFIEVRVKGVIRNPRIAQPGVILTNLRGDRGMAIWIGEVEAQALEAARLKITYRRPLTHDLLAGILEKLKARPIEVRITEIRDNIFYALIFLDTQPQPLEVDARPSDAMVLALRAGCPIMVATSVFEAQAVSLHRTPQRQYGVEVQELTEDLKRAFGFRGEGILISQVEPESNAARDGLLRGDILVQIAGTPLRHVEDLEKALDEATGDLKVRVYRGANFISMTLHPHESP